MIKKFISFFLFKIKPSTFPWHLLATHYAIEGVAKADFTKLEYISAADGKYYTYFNEKRKHILVELKDNLAASGSEKVTTPDVLVIKEGKVEPTPVTVPVSDVRFMSAERNGSCTCFVNCGCVL